MHFNVFERSTVGDRDSAYADQKNDLFSIYLSTCFDFFP